MVKDSPHGTEACLLRCNVAFATLKVDVKRRMTHCRWSAIPSIVRHEMHTNTRPDPARNPISLGEQYTIRLAESLDKLQKMLRC